MLKNKTAFITGTNRGIGKDLVKCFAQNGANIIAHARREQSDFLSFLKETAEKNNVCIQPVFFEMTDSAAMKDAVKNLFLQKAKVDILVNSAGVWDATNLIRTSIPKIKQVFDVNLFAQMELTQNLLRLLCRQKSGSIINIGSIAGIDLHAGNSAYGVSKAALAAWTKVLANEVGAFNIRVNCVMPGLIETPMGGLITGASEQMLINESSLRRKGTAAEVAQVITFLASDLSSYVNGSVIRIDGGQA